MCKIQHHIKISLKINNAFKAGQDRARRVGQGGYGSVAGWGWRGIQGRIGEGGKQVRGQGRVDRIGRARRARQGGQGRVGKAGRQSRVGKAG